MRRRSLPASHLFAMMIALLIGVAGCTNENNQPAASSDEDQDASVQTFKIMHVMSYHTPWEWTDSQFQGFQDALEGVHVEFRVFEMDTKNFSTEREKQQKGEEARAMIDAWKPDLLFTGDDDAQEYVGKYYVNTDMPIVFAAQNEDPAEYGYDVADNVTGVLEHEHFAENIKLLKEISPKNVVTEYGWVNEDE